MKSKKALQYQETFLDHVQHDLGSPRGIADLWGVLKDEELNYDEKYTLIMFFDQVFGLDLASVELPKKEDFPPPEALALLEKRLQAKKGKELAAC